MPIFLAKAIAELPGGYLWLGGGDIDIKLRVSVDEMIGKSGVSVVVGDISNPK